MPTIYTIEIDENGVRVRCSDEDRVQQWSNNPNDLELALAWIDENEADS